MASLRYWRTCALCAAAVGRNACRRRPHSASAGMFASSSLATLALSSISSEASRSEVAKAPRPRGPARDRIVGDRDVRDGPNVAKHAIAQTGELDTPDPILPQR